MQEIVEGPHVQGRLQPDALTSPEYLRRRGLHGGIAVDGADGLHIGKFLHRPPEAAEHRADGLAQIFPPVGSDDNEPAALRPVQAGVPVMRIDGEAQGVNARVSRDGDSRRRPALTQEVFPGLLGGGKMQGGEQIHGAPVIFLREGIAQIPRAQPRLHVGHGNARVKGREGPRQGRGGVPLHQDDVRADVTKLRPQGRQHTADELVQRLPRPHQVKVCVRLYPERRQRLAQHFPVLPRRAHGRLQRPAAPQLQNDRAELDGLRPRPENGQYFSSAAAGHNRSSHFLAHSFALLFSISGGAL